MTSELRTHQAHTVLTRRGTAVRTVVRAVVWSLLAALLLVGGPMIAGLTGAVDPAIR